MVAGPYALTPLLHAESWVLSFGFLAGCAGDQLSLRHGRLLALVVCAAPAMRAARVDPAITLRQE